MKETISAKLIISNILYYHASWSELMHDIKHGIKDLVLVSPRRPGLHQGKIQHWDQLGGGTATPTAFTSPSFCVSAQPKPYAQEHVLQHPISLNSLNLWQIWLQRTMLQASFKNYFALFNSQEYVKYITKFPGKEQPCLLLVMWRL